MLMCYWRKCITSTFYLEHSDPDCRIEDIIAEREIPMHSYSVHLSYPCREIEYN